MKIVLIGESYFPLRNGISSIMTMLAEGLVRKGYKVTVVTTYHVDRTVNEHNGVHIRQFKVAGNWISGMSGEVSQFIDFIDKGDWDIQHHHACQNWTFDALINWYPVRKRPVIVTPHGFSSLNNSGWKSYFDRFREVLNHIDAVTCLSSAFEEVPYLQKIGYRHYSIIPNGVNIQEFESIFTCNLRNEWGINERYWILNVSNHVGLKGHNTLHYLAENLPDTSVVNIGRPIQTRRFNLDRMGIYSGCYYVCRVKEYLISNFQTRQCNRDITVSAYKHANVFVLPSTREASPVVILEAMAAGLPWIAFDVGNVRDHEGGIIVNSKQAMVDAIRRLKNDPDFSNDLAERGKKHVRLKHDQEQIIEKYTTLYESF
ncbi:glycosyltransferase family 4 protein [Larkinella humicola]|uniref:Glycosyltransferase family 4 protein n=1 Tax=Larkinella humicola TaxID=2607654 RepID=A0A5N1JAK8_9BACT|nr:glycosyltransferase family 4 protein [Larkinella humicola]KAA9349712.1 glycosyltransferase family 4 protein [Larkinella humicola]